LHIPAGISYDPDNIDDDDNADGTPFTSLLHIQAEDEHKGMVN